jgi:hypothetical protein
METKKQYQNISLMLENIELKNEVQSLKEQLKTAQRSVNYWGTEHDLLLDYIEKAKEYKTDYLIKV